MPIYQTQLDRKKGWQDLGPHDLPGVQKFPRSSTQIGRTSIYFNPPSRKIWWVENSHSPYLTMPFTSLYLLHHHFTSFPRSRLVRGLIPLISDLFMYPSLSLLLPAPELLLWAGAIGCHGLIRAVIEATHVSEYPKVIRRRFCDINCFKFA